MLQYSKPSIDVLYKYFSDNEEDDYDSQTEEGKEHVKFSDSLKLENVSFSYDDKNKPTIKNINLNINHGDVVGIIGPTGSGKSTLIDLVLGLIRPLEGDIKVDDSSIINNRSNWNKLIGYVPQNIFLSDSTIKHNISLEFEEKKIDNKRINDLLKLCNLEKFVFSLPKKENTIIGERGARLSGGQKQRIGIARALYRNPSLLIFDEATNALDFRNEQEIMEKVLKTKKRTVIIITHRLETLKFCDYVYKIENGKLFKVEN
jgi:ABC-type bacteriocin/lantibiotic exporter with double-glycine peptidase domain